MFTTKSILSTLAAIAFCTSVNGQTTASASDVEAVVTAFTSASLIAPSTASTDTFLLPSLDNLQGTLDVYYAGSKVDLGVLKAQADVASSPSLSVTAESNATAFGTSGSLFTVILADYDANSTELDAAGGQTRHWLVNSATLDTTTTPYNVTYTSATTITDYTGPGPYAYTGAHKYVLLVIEQPSNWTAPSDLSTAGTALGVFDVNTYIATGLGDIVATNYFEVDNDPDQSVTSTEGTSASTSVVATATSTGTSAKTTGASATTTAASGTSASAAATSSAASGAGKGMVAGMGGFVAVAGALVGSLVL